MKMIQTADTHRLVCAETDRLEKLIRSGEATPRDRQRFWEGITLELEWEWAHNDAPPAELLERDGWDPDAEPVMGPNDRIMHPVAERFLTWWELNCDTPEWAGKDYLEALQWWYKPLGPTGLGALSDDVIDWFIQLEREEVSGMVVTDLETIPDGEEAA